MFIALEDFLYDQIFWYLRNAPTTTPLQLLSVIREIFNTINLNIDPLDFLLFMQPHKFGEYLFFDILEFFDLISLIRPIEFIRLIPEYFDMRVDLPNLSELGDQGRRMLRFITRPEPTDFSWFIQLIQENINSNVLRSAYQPASNLRNIFTTFYIYLNKIKLILLTILTHMV